MQCLGNIQTDTTQPRTINPRKPLNGIQKSSGRKNLPELYLSG